MTRIFSLLVLLLGLAAVPGVAQTSLGGSQPQGPLHGQQAVKPFRLIGNIHYVGLSDNTSWLITSPQGHILLDPTYETAVPTIRKNIEQLGFKVTDIKYIIQAHAHGDHIEGLAAMKELTGAKVLVMPGDADSLADGGRSDVRNDGRQLWKPVRADQILRDGEEVKLGGNTMVAHLTAGHTKGCTTWTTVAEENGRKYNVIFVCSVNVNAAVPLIGNAKYPNIVEDYKKSFALLKSLPVDVFLVSHGSWFKLLDKIKRMEQGAGQNPFIDPEGYRAYVAEREKTFLTQLQKEQSGAPASESGSR
ncbi:MAG: subclass B3 metallo-beta-lactamase [Acidobacteria bacterium]|nr:subclass B3 metallo-beta-lactamase [Acidobacteriota bacterium]